MLASISSISPDFDAIVLEIGAFYLKVGLSDEAAPRFILPYATGNTVCRDLPPLESNGLRHLPLYGTREPLSDAPSRDRLRATLRSAFTRLLVVDPMQRKVLVVTNGMKSPKRIGQIVEDVLVADLRVPSVRFLDANASSVLAHGKSQSLVVDCGFWETTCVPVFEYIPLLAYASSSSCGADAVNQQFALGDDRDSTAFDRDKFQLILPETPSGDSQDAAIEVLFTGDEDDRSIVDCILDSLTKCPVDIRKQMASSIVLTGSLAGITGLDHRLVTELKAALTTPSYAAIAHLRPVIRVSHSSFPSNTIPWVGGSLYAAMIK